MMEFMAWMHDERLVGVARTWTQVPANTSQQTRAELRDSHFRGTLQATHL